MVVRDAVQVVLLGDFHCVVIVLGENYIAEDLLEKDFDTRVDAWLQFDNVKHRLELASEASSDH